MGESAFSFNVYEQVYDENGNPLEGVFVDQNGDGIINEDDKILYHSVHPDWTASWHNTFTYKNWDFGFVLRGSFGNWVYNKNQVDNSFVAQATKDIIGNLLNDTYLFNQTRTTELMLSNHFVQNASFVRCDNITLGYTFDNLLRNKLKLRLFGAVQNPFVITNYKGIDPELTYQQGIDGSPYPRPVTFSLGLVANF